MAKNKTEETAPETAPETVTVRALTNLCEGGESYRPGDTFQTTPERAAALAGVAEPA